MKCQEEIGCGSVNANRRRLTQHTVAAHVNVTMAASRDLPGDLFVLRQGGCLVKSDITHPPWQPAPAVSLHDVRDRMKHQPTLFPGLIDGAEVVPCL